MKMIRRVFWVLYCMALAIIITALTHNEAHGADYYPRPVPPVYDDYRDRQDARLREDMYRLRQEVDQQRYESIKRQQQERHDELREKYNRDFRPER